MFLMPSRCIVPQYKGNYDNGPKVRVYSLPKDEAMRKKWTAAFSIENLNYTSSSRISHVDEDSYSMFAPSQDALDEAMEIIEELLSSEREPQLEFGGVYTAKVVEVREIGVMVTLYPSMSPALVHNSQLDQRKINHPSALGIEVGQELQVKYFGRDPVSGLMRLSRKVLQGPVSSVVRNLGDKKS